MTTFVSVVALLLVAITMALSLAHALEFPGKLRLDEATYRAVQAIYYPGFTIGGFGEFGALVVLPVLLFLTPFGTDRFWWIAAAFLTWVRWPTPKASTPDDLRRWMQPVRHGFCRAARVTHS